MGHPIANSYRFYSFSMVFDLLVGLMPLQSIPTTNIDLLFNSFATMSFNWPYQFYIQGGLTYIRLYVQWYLSQTVSHWLRNSECQMKSISLRSGVQLSLQKQYFINECLYRAEKKNKSGQQIKIQFYPVQSSFRPRFKERGR